MPQPIQGIAAWPYVKGASILRQRDYVEFTPGSSLPPSRSNESDLTATGTFSQRYFLAEIGQSHDSMTQSEWISYKPIVANTRLITPRSVKQLPVLVSTEPYQYQSSETSTTLPVVRPDLQERIASILERAREESFEDGVESQLHRDLTYLIRQHGTEVIETLIKGVQSGSIQAEVASEVLRCIGDTDSNGTRADQLRVLEHGLFAESGYVRYGAAIGLAHLNDPTALRSLRSAAQRETIPAQKHLIEQVIDQLD